MLMTQLNQVYKCSVCGNMTEVIHTGVGTIVCCGKEMTLMTDEVKPEISAEKHIPVVSKEGNTVTVKVGSVPHPMTPEHYIQWIEVITENKIYRKQLTPNDAPEATFEITEDIATVREYCNLHSLRKNT